MNHLIKREFIDEIVVFPALYLKTDLIDFTTKWKKVTDHFLQTHSCPLLIFV